MRRFLVPEVVQTSGMDCGPASLKALLEGFGIGASYGRLREACQTDIDGTSIDQIEEAAGQLGLFAEQVMVPVDHVLLTSAKVLPALIVVCLPNGSTHFVVAWRRHGRLIQLMDPAVGRRWSSLDQFRNEIYVHTHSVPAEGWREWAGSEAFLRPLRDRMKIVGIGRGARERLVEAALTDSGWHSLGVLDAGVRMLGSLVKADGVRKGSEAERLLGSLAAKPDHVPARYWSVRENPKAKGELRFTGAVLLQVHGRSKEPVHPENLSPELAAALQEKPSRPGLDLLRMLRADGFITPAVLVLAMALAAGSVLVEALLFRGLIDIGRDLSLTGQRLWAMAAAVALLLSLLLLEWPVAATVLRLSRKLECRFRLAFLSKIPRLPDRYFQSRLISDMAERSHAVHQLREVPDLGAQFLRSTFELIATVGAIAWFYSGTTQVAIAAGAVALAIPLLAQPLLAGRDLRLRNHTGALNRFYLDSLLGLTALRAHGGERPIRREQGGLLREWARAGLELQRIVVRVEAIQLVLGLALAAWLLIGYLGRTGEIGAALLLAYWALNLPVIGQDAALAGWQYPRLRNTTLRLVEPLGAPEEDRGPTPSKEDAPALVRGVAIAMERITVRAAGHIILEDVDLDIPAGTHLGIVGASGAGKSSLVGLLLGWHRPASGSLRVDGEPLDAALLEQLRPHIAWVDPQVQLWNRSMLDNLQYGCGAEALSGMEAVLENADLTGVLHRMPAGLKSALGEGGTLVSGGEGQRVRLGRAMLRRNSRLVILDEPGRGLDRQTRRKLLARAREHWQGATLLCITHDVSDTLDFPRVLVIDHGRLVEDGLPAELAVNPGSKYQSLLDAEAKVRKTLWSDPVWRRLTMHNGSLSEKEPQAATWRAN